MNKKIIVIAVVLAVLAGLVYYLKSKPATTPDSQTKIDKVGEASEFARAMQSGKPTTCVLTKGDDKMEYHIKGKLMAANITTVVEAKTTLSHMINDGTYIYMWTDESKQGTKMAIPTEEEAKAMADKAKEYGQNMPANTTFDESDYESMKNEGYTIDCKPSTVGDSVFVPPSTITFTDPSAMMKQVTMPEGGQIDYKKLQEQYGGMMPQDMPEEY